MIKMTGWTYGAEHELADWCLDTELPKGYGRDKNDITIVNSNGIANDPTGKMYKFGGEINTPPTDSIQSQVDCLSELKELLPEATVNYRSNLHVHIRVPGLIDDLRMLKKIQRFIHDNMPSAFPIIQPIIHPDDCEWPTKEEYNGYKRRYNRMKVSHQNLLTNKRLLEQLSASSIQEFFDNECPKKDGKPLPHLQPRLCVNLRQLKETETIEFRHFAGTMEESELKTAIEWCDSFLRLAIECDDDQFFPMNELFTDERFSTDNFPKFKKYQHWMEIGYRATVHDGSLSKEEIQSNIDKILAGTFFK